MVNIKDKVFLNLELKNLIDLHKGIPAYVCGHGPSLNKYINLIPSLYENSIIIGCNEWYHIYKKPHYWILANTVSTIKNEKENINNNKDVVVVYADSVDLTDKEWIKENIISNCISYDQRHFKGTKCPACDLFGCSKHLDPNRKTIQEELQEYCKYTFHYGTGDTVALHSTALAILMGCNPIYIIGVDLDYSKGYASNNGKMQHSPVGNFFQSSHTNIMRDFDIILSSARNIGVSIFWEKSK